jgi:hypothetical protein
MMTGMVTVLASTLGNSQTEKRNVFESAKASDDDALDCRLTTFFAQLHSLTAP